jgi:hypothetical protein
MHNALAVDSTQSPRPTSSRNVKHKVPIVGSKNPFGASPPTSKRKKRVQVSSEQFSIASIAGTNNVISTVNAFLHIFVKQYKTNPPSVGRTFLKAFWTKTGNAYSNSPMSGNVPGKQAQIGPRV